MKNKIFYKIILTCFLLNIGLLNSQNVQLPLKDTTITNLDGTITKYKVHSHAVYMTTMK